MYKGMRTLSAPNILNDSTSSVIPRIKFVLPPSALKEALTPSDEINPWKSKVTVYKIEKEATGELSDECPECITPGSVCLYGDS
jgi:hypothetical protein